MLDTQTLLNCLAELNRSEYFRLSIPQVVRTIHMAFRLRPGRTSVM